MKKPVLILLLLVVMSLISLSSYANDLQISNVSLSNQNTTAKTYDITFDMGWKNSWRLEAAPGNYDAAWLFVKVRGEGSEWQHAKILSAGSNAPAGATLDVVSDSLGAFIYRSANGIGENIFNSVVMQWHYGSTGVVKLKDGYSKQDMAGLYEYYDEFGNRVTKEVATELISMPDNPLNLEVRLLGVEMVYIPQGPFYVGDGENGWVNGSSSQPLLIENDLAYQLGAEDGQLNLRGQVLNGIIPEEFPMGYNAFYVMKYNVSAEQYLVFLNSLTRNQQSQMTNSNIEAGLTNTSNRYVLNNNIIKAPASFDAQAPITFYLDLNNNDIPNEVNDGADMVNSQSYKSAAYLDWIGLRPISEFEFEKTARGPLAPVVNENTWGTTYINYYDNFRSLPTYGTGTETVPAEFNFPMSEARAGLFADGANNREEAGAAYYGVLELSNGGACLKYSTFSFTLRNGTGFFSIHQSFGSLMGKYSRTSSRHNYGDTSNIARGVRSAE